MPPHLPFLYHHLYICLHSFEVPPHLPCFLLANLLPPLSSASLHSFIYNMLQFSTALLRKWVISPPTSVSWPQSPVLLQIQPGCTYFLPSVAYTYPTEILHSNARDFFSETRPVTQCSPLWADTWCKRKKKERKKGKGQWKTMTRETNQSV